MNKSFMKKLEKFLSILIIMGIFLIFGNKNLVVAFGTVIIATSFFTEDYTARPLVFINKMVFIQVGLGIATYIANLNIILTLVVSFLVIFAICYGFSYDFKPAKSSGFVMMYLFLLFSKVPIEDMPKRLLALVVSGIVIIIQYYYFTNHNFEKTINSQILNISNSLKEELEKILKGGCYGDTSKLSIQIKNAEVKIHERLEDSKKDTSKTLEKSIIIFTLANLNRNLKKVKKTEENEYIIKDIISFIDSIRAYANGEITLLEVREKVDNYYLITKNIKDTKGIDKYRFYNIKLTIREFQKFMDNKEKFIEFYKSDRIERFKVSRRKGSNTSIRWNLALKTSISVSVAIFIVNYYGVYIGKWLPFTISILILPFVEQSNQRIKDRVIGTVIGVIAFEVLYQVIGVHKPIFWIVFIICLFFGFTIRQYNKRVIFITIMSMTMVLLLVPNSTGGKIGFYRLLLNLGAIIVVGIIANTVFPYSVKDDTIKAMDELIKNCEDTLEMLVSNIQNYKEMDNLMLINTHYFRRLNFNNLIIKNSDLNKLLSFQTEFVSDVLFIYKKNKYMKSDDIFVKNVQIIENNFKGEELLEKIKELFYSAPCDKERLIILSLFRIYSDLNSIKDIVKKIKLEIS